MKKIFLLILVSVFFQTPKAKAYYTFLTTGDLPQQKEYKVTSFVQLITDGPVGTTVNAQLESYFRDDISLLFAVGAGAHQVISASAKWVPIPDLDKQASLGVLLGVHIGKFKTTNTENNESKSKSQQDFSIFTKAFLSKEFSVESGTMKSFASLHLGVQKLEDKTQFPMLIGVGTELNLQIQPKFKFIGELGFNLNQAFTYISAGAVFVY